MLLEDENSPEKKVAKLWCLTSKYEKGSMALEEFEELSKRRKGV
jgi:hypothetical protein